MLGNGRRRSARPMKLFEHPDFEQAIIRAAEHFRTRGLREAIIEKDYYVTEALRIIETAAGDKVIFKGGTSLSKGWNLIHRFSEDIDIFLDPTAFDPRTKGRSICVCCIFGGRSSRRCLPSTPKSRHSKRKARKSAAMPGIITTCSAWWSDRKCWRCCDPTNTPRSRLITTESAGSI